MKKILFTGATGLLGKYFFNKLLLDVELIGTSNKNLSIKNKKIIPLNITNKEEVFSLINKVKPDYVIHAAAIGNVDYCETHREETIEINVMGTESVAKACKESGAVMIFTSSNAVYDGKNPPYSEKSIINPLDFYGKTKEMGEEAVKKSNVKYVIVRLMTMYGWPPPGGRNNPVGWVINELKKNNKINVVDDIFNNHLYAGQASDTIWEIINKNKINQTYNIAGAESISRYELALKTAEVFGLNGGLIKPVSSDYFTSLVPRPKNTTFDITKMKKELNIKPLKVEDGLRKMRDEK